MENLRAGRHECFDRIVIDLGADPQGRPADKAIGYRVGVCVIGARHRDRGNHPHRRGAILSIQVNAPAHDDDLRPDL